ncbi:MAG: YceD family protein [Gammaproteobacteria bacterium]|jgi:uncharacterized protein
MTSERLPVRLNPFRLVEQGRILKGRVSLAKMERLAGLLAAPADTAEVELRFFNSETGHPMLAGSISAVLTLLCQRCLEPMPFKAEVRLELLLVHSDAEAQRLQEGFETLLVEDETLEVSDLVEDELMLALPMAPSHSPEQCAVKLEQTPRTKDDDAAPRDEDRDNPFAVLKQMK